MLTCYDCHLPKAEEEFGWKSEPKGMRLGRCKECRRAYDNAWHAANRPRRTAIINASNRRGRARVTQTLRDYKAQRGCADCGETDPIVLEFDHLDGKEFTIGSHRVMSMPKIWLEVAKCEVVCSNCHKRRTHYRRLEPETGIEPAL